MVVDGQHLGQIFLQGYYAMTENRLDTLIVGITDSVSWHLFKIGKSTESPREGVLLTVHWYLSCDNVEQIVAFLATCLSLH